VARRGSIPLVDVSIRIATGNTANPPDAPGTASAVFELLNKGTKKYDANELSAAMDKIAMGARLGAGPENSSLSYRILRTHLNESLELAAEILRNPTFPEDELNKIKQQLNATLATIKRNPARNASSLFNRAIYGATNTLGMVWTPDLVDDFSVDNLRDFHTREISPDNMTIFMIGNLDIVDAQAAVESAFENWKTKGASQRAAIGSARESRARVILVNQADAVQSTIIVGHAIPPFDAATNTELTLVNAVFGGTFESRINMNLREDKGWTYGMGSRVRRNISGDQTLIVTGSVQTDKTMESMQEVMREYEDYVSTRPATIKELNRIKLNRTRSLPGSFSSNRGFLGSMMTSDSFGLPFDYAEGTAARLAAVSLDDVISRSNSLIHKDKLTWVVIGDLAQIEEKVRSLDYGDVEVWDGFGNKVR
jgi:zinc protease